MPPEVGFPLGFVGTQGAVELRVSEALIALVSHQVLLLLVVPSAQANEHWKSISLCIQNCQYDGKGE